MKKIIIPTEAMKLEPVQYYYYAQQVLPDKTVLPQTCGDTAAVINLRRQKNGIMTYMGKPEEVLRPEREIAFTDTRSDGIYYFSVESRILRIEAITDNNYNVIDDTVKEVCQLPADFKEAAQAGEFLVLLLTDGSLFYILYEGDLYSYTAMGTVPNIPEFSVELEAEPDITATVEDINFSSAVDDMRSGVPESVRMQVDSKLRSTFASLTTKASNANAYIQPVKVRVGLRLWDDRLLALSDTIEVEAYGPQPAERIILPMTYEDNKGWTGTTATAVSVQSYRLRFKSDGVKESRWASVIRRLEIYVSAEPDILDNNSSASVSYLSAQKSLGCFMPLKSDDESDDVTWRLTATLPACETADILLKPESTQEDVELESNDYTYEADHIEGFGSFLYISKKSEVTVMHRNNPFTPEGVMACGSQVRFMTAQSIVGGAYTRQILYLFTDNGTMVLMHDADGVPTNCRPVSSETVSAAHSITKSSSGVWIISDTGSLVCFKDTRSEVMLANMAREYSILAWHHELNELWLISTEQNYYSIVMPVAEMSVNNPVTAYMSSFIPDDLLWSGQEGLFKYDGAIYKASTTSPKVPDSDMRAYYITGPYYFDEGGISLLSVSTSSVTDMYIGVYRESGKMMARNHYTKKSIRSNRATGVNFMLPDVKNLLTGLPIGIQFHVDGYFLKLKSIVLYVDEQ
jgi:hypothetical protein